MQDQKGEKPNEAEIEREQQEWFRTCYVPILDTLAASPRSDYAAKMTTLRLNLVLGSYDHGSVLDLCCGPGDFLKDVAPHVERVIGVDFSPELVDIARQRTSAQTNVSCCIGSARTLPLKSASVALVFSFSSLYYIPHSEDVVTECARVLEPGGAAILEFGILYSLNTLVCRSYPDLASPCHIPLSTALRMVKQAGLTIESDRAFQLLPLWGSKPTWLRPLLHPYWRLILERDVRGQTVDELVSSLRVFRHFSFRHIIVCKKPF